MSSEQFYEIEIKGLYLSTSWWNKSYDAAESSEDKCKVRDTMF